jgi:hypothetical protein
MPLSPPLLHLKSFLASPRAYLAARLNRAQHTDINRWSDPAILYDHWDERTALMASMIAMNSTVLEFGAGNERIRGFLPAGCRYQPCDIVARSAHTLVCNLNVAFPALDTTWDVMVFSGVLEYIEDVPALLANVRIHAKNCILSYHPIDTLECLTTRLQGGWVNHYTQAAMENIIAKAGFTIAEQRSWSGQNIYSLR